MPAPSRTTLALVFLAAVPLVGAGLFWWVSNYERLLGFAHFDVPFAGATVDDAVGRAAAAGAPVNLARLEDGSVRLFPKAAERPLWRSALARGEAARGAVIARDGTQAGASACNGCHGAQGQPDPGQGVPRLAGMEPAYLVKQLVAYGTGLRRNEVMQGIAAALRVDEMADLAIHYGALIPAAAPSATGDAPSRAPSDQVERGRLIHTIGLNDQGIQACANCHGADARGGRPLIPALAALEAPYFAAQMKAYAEGTRTGDSGTLVMKAVASRLAPADLEALGVYFAGLSPVPQAQAPRPAPGIAGATGDATP